LTHALARTGSLDGVSHKPPVRPERKVGRVKVSVVSGKSRSRSSRAGLIFPVGRLRRHLKTIMVGQKVGLAGSIYTAAVLEYLTA
jgi:histone H2A